MLKPLIHSGLALALALSCITPAAAMDYYVRNRDSDGLVAAIRHANDRPGADTIHLAEGGLYMFSRSADAGLALPPIRGRLYLVGNGAELRRNSDEGMALLVVAAQAELDIDALTLAEGSSGSSHMPPRQLSVHATSTIPLATMDRGTSWKPKAIRALASAPGCSRASPFMSSARPSASKSTRPNSASSQ